MLRWWDGDQWTEHRTDDGTSIQQPEPQRWAGPTKTSGWAIASLVLGIAGGVVIAIVCGVIAKDRIRRSGGRLTGDGIANAGIALGSVWAVVLLALLAINDLRSQNNAHRYSGADKAIATVVDQVQNTLEDDQGDRACADLFTEAFAARIARGSGGPCGDAVDTVVAGGQYQAHLSVKDITRRGAVARVQVSEGGDPETWTMRYERGSWRVDAIVSR